VLFFRSSEAANGQTQTKHIGLCGFFFPKYL
jgi:hypothetical protein